MVSRLKLLFVFLLGLFGLVWFAAIVPDMASSSWWTGLNPFQQYFVYNVGIFLVISVGFGSIIALALTQKISLMHMFLNGFAGFLLFSFILDNYSPPFAVSHAGTLIIPTGDTLAPAAVDYMLGWAWTSAGLNGPAVYWMVYIVTPALAVVLAVVLLGLNRFTAMFAEMI